MLERDANGQPRGRLPSLASHLFMALGHSARLPPTVGGSSHLVRVLWVLRILWVLRVLWVLRILWVLWVLWVLWIL